MKRYWFIFITIASLSNVRCRAQVVTDGGNVFHYAAESHRPILLIFAGSDWCAPCIRFERNILSREEFIDFAKQKVVVYQADFPQQKKISKQQQQQNEELAERYNAKGAFPCFVLVRPDRSVITTLGFNDESVHTFIKKISRFLEDEQAKNIQKTN